MPVRGCDSDKVIEGKQSSAQWAGNAKFLQEESTEIKMTSILSQVDALERAKTR